MSMLNRYGTSSTSNHVPSHVLCIDVECVATGRGHNDRAPCWVAICELEMKNGKIRQVMDLKMKPDFVYHYLEYVSGCNESMLRSAPSVPSAILQVHALFKQYQAPVVIGWNVENDLEWMKLQPQEHYHSYINLIKWFRHPQSKRDGSTFMRPYSLAHVAATLLNMEIREARGSHSPVSDAEATLKLFQQYHENNSCQPSTNKLRPAIHRIRNTPIDDSHQSAARMGDFQSGVCGQAYAPERCTCGQPTKRRDND